MTVATPDSSNRSREPSPSMSNDLLMSSRLCHWACRHRGRPVACQAIGDEGGLLIPSNRPRSGRICVYKTLCAAMIFVVGTFAAFAQAERDPAPRSGAVSAVPLDVVRDLALPASCVRPSTSAILSWRRGIPQAETRTASLSIWRANLPGGSIYPSNWSSSNLPAE